MELAPGGGGIPAGGVFRLSTRLGRYAEPAGDHRGLRRGIGAPGFPGGDGRHRRRAPVSETVVPSMGRQGRAGFTPAWPYAKLSGVEVRLGLRGTGGGG